MESYRNFIGIDIGKKSFFVNLHGKKPAKEYDNTPGGIRLFLKGYKTALKDAFCVLEATGGYEMRLLLTLCGREIAVHRANTRKVKHFVQSLSNGAKTDALDARALAQYGYERSQRLDLFSPNSQKALDLYELSQRRKDLRQILVAEKNRRKAPLLNLVKSSIEKVIDVVSRELELVDEQIKELITKDEVLLAKYQVLLTIPGVGPVVAAELLAMMPELGTMSRRQVAALAGLAPRANDSGQFRGYRHTAPGRNQVKPMLFMAAMAARNSNSRLKTFYNQLIARGKRKMVALVALMRKIVVIANAKLKELANQPNKILPET
jgi:transposase